MQETNVNTWATLPNAITTARILGSPVMMLLAWLDLPLWLGALTVFLVFTEWLDGFLARRFRLSSAIGARLDTVADAIFYSSLLAAIVMLRPRLIAAEPAWIAAAIGSYALSWLASLFKFRRLPSYHTWAAKGVWILVGIGVICLLSEISPWPFRIAMLCVMFANLEAVAITLLLPECHVDVPTYWHARRIVTEFRRIDDR